MSYHIQLPILENKASSTLFQKWQQNNEAKELHISSGTKDELDVLVTEKAQFVPYELKCVEGKTNTAAIINGQEFFTVFPTKEETLTEIMLERGKSSRVL